MNCQFNKPIRTYERKKFKEVIIPLPKLVISTFDNKNRVPSINKLNEVEEKEIGDDSLYNDPFETTFDRLLKNARIASQLPKTHNKSELFSGTDSNSEISDHKSSLRELCSFSIKPVSKQKTTRPKLKMQVMKKKLVKKKKSVLENNGKLKAQADNSHKKYKVYRTRNNNKMTSNFDIDFLSFSSETKDSEMKTYNKAKRKAFNKKGFVKRRKKDVNMSNLTSINNIEIKQCSVKLDRFSVSKYKVNVIENNLSEKTDHLSNQHKITETCNNNLKHNDESVKHCFVKIEQLEMDSYIKPHSFGKGYENVVSSTPNGRPVRPSTHFIPLSPIPIGYFEKLKNSATYTNSISTNDNNEVSLESKQINADSCKRSNLVEKYESKEKHNLLSSYLTNTCNFSKCNLNRSENTDKRNIDSLTALSYNNDSCDKRNLLTERDSMQNTPRNEIEQNDILEKSVLTQEHENVNMKKKKQHLRFSIDANTSRSLFGDSKESIQTPEINEVNNIAKEIVTSNLMIEKSTVLNNEMSPIKLSEESILNTSSQKKVTSDKTQKELTEGYIPSILISDASADDIELTLKTKRIDDKSKDLIDVNKQTLLNRNSTINITDSFVDNGKKHSMQSSYVVLNQLRDPIRVTKRRKYTKWDLDLNSIPEDCNNSTASKEEQTLSKIANKGRQTILSEKKLSLLENVMEECTNNALVAPGKSVYLKPGKSWARSLSILNNIKTESNLDKLSVGKGKNWRHSVQDILNMQKQGIIQSCIKKNDGDKELQISDEIINKSEHELANNSRTCDSTNLGHVSRKISVRVVPICKTVKSIEDAQFLEVYGIVPIKSQRFTLLNNPRKSSTCNIQNDVDGQTIEEHAVSTAREVIFQRCFQKTYIPFSTYFSDSYLEHCRKIGEGVYGEVFLYEDENKKSVIKIIPIEGSEYVNGEPQKKFHEILSEIVIAMELHNLRFNTKYNTDGFVEVKNIKCIKGKYPEKLIELWNIYDKEKRSDNDCPSMFNDDQLYIVLELGNGGQDLEAFVFNTAEEAYILFIQAALTIAVAETAVQFEHRDLHWGNILISPTNESSVHYKLGKKNIELISKGVKVSIIDFTLSRITYQGCSVFNDLASDPTLFTAQGEYQFEIYRLMRDKVMNNWQKFEPYTNILWLHYTLDKMITAVRYKKRNLKIHKNGITKLKELKNEILTYNSALDFVTNCDKIVNLLCIDSKLKTTHV